MPNRPARRARGPLAPPAPPPGPAPSDGPPAPLPVLRALDAAERGPWATLADPDKAARRALGVLDAAGWLPDGPRGSIVLGGPRAAQRAVDRLLPWLEALDPDTARDYVRRARQALAAAGLGASLAWPTLRGSSRRRGRALDPGELRDLLAAFDRLPGPAGVLAAGFARWLLLTGARPGEARRARWRDLDLGGPRPLWRVLGTKTPAARRTLPLDAAHLGVLGPVGEADALVWPLSEWTWRRAWAEASGSSGLAGPDLTPYVLRHTFATRALERGLTYEQVAAWLGHASGDTLRKHYRHAVAPVAGVGALLEDVV